MAASLSRRELFQGAAALGIGAAFAGMTGCSSTNYVKPDEAVVEEVDGASFDVFQADVLIIGGGGSAVWMAKEMLGAGHHIMIVDKAPFRHSGASGMSWDCQMLWFDGDMSTYVMTGYNGTPNSTADRNIWQRAYDYVGMDEGYYGLMDMLNNGETFPARTEDSSFLPNRAISDTTGAFFRREMDDLYTKPGVSVMDEVMVTDLLINDGRCLGAIGVHLPTGTVRVIRANATVMACGAANQFRGRHNIGSFSVSPNDLTGDVQMALARHGVGIAGNEIGNFDVFATEPADLAHSMGACLMVDASAYDLVYDANHERLFPEPINGSNHLECETIVRAIYEEGRGNENNRVYAHLGEASNLTYYVRKNVGVTQKFGLDPMTEWVEIYPEMYEKGGQPLVNEQMMTEVEGLFNPRGANALGFWCGWVSMHNLIFSRYTGKCVVDYLDAGGMGEIAEVDWTPVVEECKRLTALRTAAPQDPIRPHELRAEIQDAGGHGFDFYRPTAWMEEAIAELERIRKEDLPRQAITSSSPTYNTEWKMAIENVNLLDAAEMSIRAALMREESRGCYRPEFPEVDDENWSCLISGTCVDGVMEFEKVSIPEYKGQA